MRQQQAGVDHQDVEGAGQVQRDHELAQRDQLLEAVGTHQRRDQAEGAHGRGLQHEAGDLDHHLARLVHQRTQARRLLPQPHQREADQAREEDHLQDGEVAGHDDPLPVLGAAGAQRGQGAHRVLGHDVDQHVQGAGHVTLAVGLGHLQAGRVHAHARLQHQPEGQADGHRQHRGDGEPDEGPCRERRDRALPGQRTHGADHREEHQRDGDHLDQVDVNRAQGPEPRLRRRPQQPARDRAEHEARGHPLPERDLEPGGEGLHRRPLKRQCRTLAHAARRRRRRKRNATVPLSGCCRFPGRRVSWPGHCGAP